MAKVKATLEKSRRAKDGPRRGRVPLHGAGYSPMRRKQGNAEVTFRRSAEHRGLMGNQPNDNLHTLATAALSCCTSARRREWEEF